MAPKTRKKKRHVRDFDEISVSGQMRVPWTSEEEEIFYKAVKQWHVGSWSAIVDVYGHKLSGRTNVNLKDKWRQMVRAGRVRQLADKFGDDVAIFNR